MFLPPVKHPLEVEGAEDIIMDIIEEDDIIEDELDMIGDESSEDHPESRCDSICLVLF